METLTKQVKMTKPEGNFVNAVRTLFQYAKEVKAGKIIRLPLSNAMIVKSYIKEFESETQYVLGSDEGKITIKKLF